MAMEFSLSVAAKLIADEVEKGSNVVVSPISTAIALNLLTLGSNGYTLEDFTRFLVPQETNNLILNSVFLMNLMSVATAAPRITTLPMNTHFHITSCVFASTNHPILESTALIDMNNYPFPDLDREPRFHLLNALIIDQSISLKQSFVQTAFSSFNAYLKFANMINQAERVKADVNTWIENMSNGNLKDFLSPTIQLSPPICLVNALNLKGAWKMPFDPSNTRGEFFELLNGEMIAVPFMTMTKQYHLFQSFDDYKLLALPYQKSKCSGSGFAVCFFLPNKRDGIKDLIRNFDKLDHNYISLPRVALSQVCIPKVKFSCCYEFRELLKAKGLTRPFEPEYADFSNMVEGIGSAHIGSIAHKAFFEVHEIGTGDVELLKDVSQQGNPSLEETLPRMSFVADHPFLFIISEEFSKRMVFAGAVLNPLQY